MKSKVGRGEGILGLLNYIFRRGKAGTAAACQTILSTNLSGVSPSPREMSREMRAVTLLKPNVKRPLMHISLSLVEGEKLDGDTWRRLIQRYIKKMGFPPDTLFVSALHNDTKCQHAHVALSRISLSGKVWLGQWEARRSIGVCQELEKEFGLRLTPGLHGDDDELAKSNRPDRQADPQSVINANRAKGQPRIDTVGTARVLLECARRSRDLPSFTAAAARVGITVLPNRSAATGYVSGLSVVPKGRRKPVPLGDATRKKLTWPKLLKIFQQTDDAADAAQRAGRDVVAAAGQRAARVVDSRLLQQADNLPDHESQSEPMAILPSLVTTEAQAMARHQLDLNDQLGFLSEPPPPRPGGRLDDAALGEGEAARRERERRERDSAALALAAELEGATKKKLELARRALTSELRADDAEAIAAFVLRLSRLVIRLVTLGQVVLPPSESERRAHVARHTIERIDAELRRRADAQSVQSPARPAEAPGAGEFEARRRGRQAVAARKAQAVAPKPAVAHGHDARPPAAGSAPVAVEVGEPSRHQRDRGDRG